jgi:hypothetical protein
MLVIDSRSAGIADSMGLIMKTAATAILVLSGLGLAIFLARFAVCSFETPPGMLNPSLRIELPPGRQVQFLVLFLWVLAAAYFYLVVAWAERQFKELRSRLPAAAAEFDAPQPPDVKRLKDAIRGGDTRLVREHASEDALAFRDEGLLTPYELAELYGDEAVIEAVREVYRRRRGGRSGRSAGVPASRFAVGRRDGGSA